MSEQTTAYIEIAARLKGLREAMDLTVQDMAVGLGIEPDMVKLYESGAHEIPVSYLHEAARFCRVDLTVLAFGKEAHLHSHSLVRQGRGMSVERRKDYDYWSLAYSFASRRMEPFLVKVPARSERDLVFNEHPDQRAAGTSQKNNSPVQVPQDNRLCF